MGTRARFTEAELSRAVRVADKLKKIVVQTRMGIAFVAPDAVTSDTRTAQQQRIDDWFDRDED